jgi:hypothetical protein
VQVNQAAGPRAIEHLAHALEDRPRSKMAQEPDHDVNGEQCDQDVKDHAPQTPPRNGFRLRIHLPWLVAPIVAQSEGFRANMEPAVAAAMVAAAHPRGTAA